MGIDLATIGVKVDTSDLAKGEAALDQFAGEGEKAEKRIDKSTKAIAADLKRPGAAAKTLAPEMKGAAREATGFQNALKGPGVRNFAQQMNQVAQQTAAGGGFFRALTIQMPDLLLGFGTLGIAAGVAAPAIMGVVGALFSTENAGEALENRLESLSKAVSKYRSASNAISMTSQQLEDAFGSQSGAIQTALDFQAQLAKADAMRELEAGIVSVTKAFGGLSRSEMVTHDTTRGFWASMFDKAPVGLIKEIDNTFHTIRSELELTEEQAAQLTFGLEALANAEGLESQIQAGSALNDIFIEIYGNAANIPESLRGMAGATAEAAVQAARIVGSEEALEIIRQRNLVQAQELVGAVVQEAEMRALVAQYGEDSAQVEEARAAIQRDILAGKLDELGVSQEVKDELLASVDAAWDVAAGAEGAAGALSAAANEASRMASEVQRAVNGMINLAAQGATSLRQSEIRLENRGDPVSTARELARQRAIEQQSALRKGAGPHEIAYLDGQAEALARNAAATEANRQALIKWQRAQNQVTGGGGGRGGGRASSRGAGRDPMTEHLRDAEALFRSTRTKAEQYATELARINQLYKMGLIDAETYARATDHLNDKFDETKAVALEMEGALENMFVSILNRSEDAGDAIANLAKQLGNMALQAAFSGLFGGLFDGISSIFSSGQGNVFSGGNRVAFGNGGVVNGRTTFPMANGQTGEAGEMGAEAIIPLRRGSDGKLGVRADMPQAVQVQQVQGGDTITVTFAPEIDATGADPAQLRRTQEQLARMQMEFESRVVQAVQNGKKRRLL